MPVEVSDYERFLIKVLCCALLVLALLGCAALAESGKNLLPGVLGLLYEELYVVLEHYEESAASPPLLASEQILYNALQTSRASAILEITSELEGTVAPAELARVLDIIAPHCHTPD